MEISFFEKEKREGKREPDVRSFQNFSLYIYIDIFICH
jgi:hypothetical protein